MKLKKIFFISGFCIIIFLLISCGENKKKPDFNISSNITNGKIQTDNIKINLLSKNIEIFMNEKTNNVKIMSF